MSRAVPKRLGLAAVTLITAMLGLSAIPAFAEPGTGSIGGHLMDGATPVSAFVVAYAPDNTWVAETFTDENGAYQLDGLAPGDYKVGFRLPGFVTQFAHQKLSFEAADLIAVADGETTVLDEQVLPHGSIAGQVTTSSGEPSPNPYILVYRDFDLFAQNAGDAEGNYVVPYIPAGVYRVQIRPQDGPEQWAHQAVQFEQADLFEVTVGNQTTVNETLLETGTIRGRLTDDGAPVSGASLNLDPDGSDGSSEFANTNEDGAFEIRALPGRYRLFFQLPNGLTQYAHEKRDYTSADIYTVTPGSEIVINEEALPTGTIRGRLTDFDGNPVANAGVSANDPTTSVSGSTDGDGTYELKVLAGTYKIQFQQLDGQGQWAHGKVDRLTADQFTVGADEVVTVDEQFLQPGTLTVTAHDAKTGLPIDSFCANPYGPVYRFDCTTTGEVVFHNMGPGTYGLSANVEDGRYVFVNTEGVVIRSGETTAFDVRMQPAATITTVVKDRRTGAPVENTCVFAIDVLKHQRIGSGSGIGCADGTGAVKIEQLPAGIYNLFAFTGDQTHGHQWVGPNGGTGKQQLARLVTVRAGESVTVPAIKMDGAGSITGVITDKATGAPLNFAQAGLSSGHPGAGDGITVGTGPDGKYTFNGLGPYEWPFLFGHFEHVFQWSGGVANRLLATGIKVREGQATTYNVALGKGTTVKGTIATAAGEPLSGGFISAYNAITGDIMSASEMVNGHYTLHLLAPQVVRLRYEGGSPDVWFDGWYVNSGDFDHATPVIVPLSGTKTVNIVATRTRL